MFINYSQQNYQTLPKILPLTMALTIAKHRTLIPAFAVLACLSITLTGCTGTAMSLSNSLYGTDAPNGNAVQATTDSPPEEAKKQLESYLVDQNIEISSSDGNTIRTGPATLTSSNELSGQSEETVRMIMRMQPSDEGTAVTVVAEAQAGATGEWKRIEADASGSRRALRKVHNFVEEAYGEDNVQYADTDLTY
jgi:hypothetical protein